MFVVCLCLPRVVDMLCVHAWPSVALECVNFIQLHIYTPIIGNNIYVYVYDCVLAVSQLQLSCSLIPVPFPFPFRLDSFIPSPLCPS